MSTLPPINEYLAAYRQALTHQRMHGAVSPRWVGEVPQPWEYCMECLKRGDDTNFPMKRRYSWAVPSGNAIRTIADYSPRGVVEIGAGGGYWAMLLRRFGVDVIAYDPEPGESKWHEDSWSEVLFGDHTSVIGHADRTLMLCWPSYEGDWSHEVLDLYDGDTVIYVGEGMGGCTGTDRMHALLGEEPYCWHDDEPCTCDWPEPRFEEVTTEKIPQFSGLHDRLYVYRRKAAQS